MKKGDTFIPTHPYMVFYQYKDGVLFANDDGESSLKRANASYNANREYASHNTEHYKGVYLVDLRTMKILKATEFKEPK
jgi:hypothetical protein